MLQTISLIVILVIIGSFISSLLGWFIAKAMFKIDTVEPSLLSPGEHVMVSSDGRQWEIRTYAYYQSGFYYCKILNHEHMMKAQPWAMCVKLEISAS